jgi:CheY-like chemotaxis protein
MSTKILLIESDAGFARELADALESAGYEARSTGDGREGFETAREWGPDAIVLCTELPGTSGYLVCQKLKKDEALKDVPLVLTSAEATPETFEKHKQLKVRAQEYLLKPFAPDDLVTRIEALVGPGGARAADEEVVSLEEEMGLEGLGAETDALPALDLALLPDEPAAAPAGGGDDDLKLLYEAFDGLSEPSAARDDAGAEAPAPEDALDLAAEGPPPGDDTGTPGEEPALEDEADRALGALDDEAPPEPPARELRTTIRGASADLLRAAGIPLASDAGPARPAPRGAGARDLDRAERSAEDARALRAKLDAAQAQARETEAELRRAEERAETAEADLAAAQRSAEEAAEAAARARELESRVEELEAELAEARSQATAAKTDVEKRGAELRRRVQDLEAAAAKGEERVLKAYQKIKNDERLREKTRKALAIALQLLDEGAPSSEGPEKKIASVLGRD